MRCTILFSALMATLELVYAAPLATNQLHTRMFRGLSPASASSSSRKTSNADPNSLSSGYELVPWEIHSPTSPRKLSSPRTPRMRAQEGAAETLTLLDELAAGDFSDQEVQTILESHRKAMTAQSEEIAKEEESEELYKEVLESLREQVGHLDKINDNIRAYGTLGLPEELFEAIGLYRTRVTACLAIIPTIGSENLVSMLQYIVFAPIENPKVSAIYDKLAHKSTFLSRQQ